GLDVLQLAATIGDAAARSAPAASVALLLERELIRSGRLKPAATEAGVERPAAPDTTGVASGLSRTVAVVDTVLKLGGSVLAHPQHFESSLKTIEEIARVGGVLVVPGGGWFADAVREADQR